MAHTGPFVLRDVRALVGGFDISGYSNRLEMAFEVPSVDRTTFQCNSRRRLGGIKKGDLTLEGFTAHDSGTPDGELWDSVGSTNIVSIYPEDADAGNYGYFGTMLQSVFTPPNGRVGDMAKFTYKGGNDGDIVMGTSLLYDTLSGSGSATGQLISAVGAGETMYACMQVLSTDGTTPTLDVIIESDTDIGFASPVTRMTFAQVTTSTGAWIQSVGPTITDTYWRASYTLGGVSPEYQVAILIGKLTT